MSSRTSSLPHLESDMFIMEGACDSFQLGAILGLEYTSYGDTLSKCSAAQNA
jgi:hypothetical protein